MSSKYVDFLLQLLRERDLCTFIICTVCFEGKGKVCLSSSYLSLYRGQVDIDLWGKCWNGSETEQGLLGVEESIKANWSAPASECGGR